MQKRVWIFQYPKEVKAKGADKATWYVGWYSEDGKRRAESCGAGEKGKKLAEKKQRRKQSELDMHMDNPESKKTWQQFRAEYEAEILPRLAGRSQAEVKTSLEHFERIARPGKMRAIRKQTIDQFVKERLKQRGKKTRSLVSPATVNKDLRHIKAALREAHERGYLPKMPRVKMVREQEKLPSYVTPEHFATIYRKACPLAEFPKNPEQHYEPVDWWRALAVTAYMTGWRVSELLALRKEDLDLYEGVMITRAADNKGKRDEQVTLHPVVIEHLRKIVGFHPLVFRWCHDYRTLWVEFTRIQKEAGIKLPCRADHEHTDSCHVYGFHDFRRAFATMNELPAETLQRLMRHRSFTTTQRYINLRNRLRKAAETLYVPDALRTGTV